jgi:hypothetical protein
MLTQDFILNGTPHGEVATLLEGMRFDAGLLRPYIDQNNRRCVTLNTGRTWYNPKSQRQEPIYEKRTLKELAAMDVELPVQNAATLRKDEWIELDRTLLRVARPRLRAWSDLAARSSYGGFNGFNRTILEYEMMNDPGEAIVDMDGITEGRADSPRFTLQGLPLPITHSDFWFSSRRLGISRNGGTPLDMAMGEAAARRVAETVEKTLIGSITGITYGDSTGYGGPASIYGYTNYPDRLTFPSLTEPTGANGDVTVNEVLEMRQLAYENNHFGPFMLYHSTDWDRFLDDDYYVSGGNNPNQTLRDRIRAIEGIEDIRRLDYLDAETNPFTFLLVEMTSEVARAVIGMPLTTIQWDMKGGLQKNFKVMTIMVPQLRADINGTTGIIHASAA